MDFVRSGSVIPFDFAGLQIRDLTSNSLPSASVAQIEVAPGAAHPKAKSTRSDKLYFCVEGTVIFACDGKCVPLEPMDLLVVRKNEWFEYHNESTRAAKLLLVHVTPFDLESEIFVD